MDANEYEGLSKSNASKFRSYYENEYKTLYPVPLKHIIGLDWKFWGLVITSVSTVVVAALRTAQMFYFAEELSSKFWTPDASGNWVLGFAGSFFSMMAFEGGLAFISAIKTAEKEKVESWVYNTQIALLLLISIVAGLGQSMGLVRNISPTLVENFSYFLVFVVGVGASIAAWLSGEILGVQLQKFSVKKKEAEEKFSEEMKFYTQNARKFWKQRTEQEKETSREQRKIEQNPRIETSLRSSPRVQNRTGGGKVPIIFSEIEKFLVEQNRIPSFSELAEVLRTNHPEQNFSSNGYISTVRKNWIEANTEQAPEVQNEN